MTREAEALLHLNEDWERTESKRFYTSDGSSSYARAMREWEDLVELRGEEGYVLSSRVSVKPDYFPIITDVLDDGLIYEMGFSVFVNGTECGRLESFSTVLPNRVVLLFEGMALYLPVRGLHIGRRKEDGSQRRPRQEEAVLHLGDVQEADHEPQEQGLPQVRGEGHPHVQGMGRGLRGLQGVGHVPRLQGRPDDGPREQQQGLRARERPLDKQEGPGEEQDHQHVPDRRRQEHEDGRVGRAVRRARLRHSQAPAGGMGRQGRRDHTCGIVQELQADEREGEGGAG